MFSTLNAHRRTIAVVTAAAIGVAAAGHGARPTTGSAASGTDRTCTAPKGSTRTAPGPVNGSFRDPAPYVPVAAGRPPTEVGLDDLPLPEEFKPALDAAGFVRGARGDDQRGSLTDSVLLFGTTAGAAGAFRPLVDQTVNHGAVLGNGIRVKVSRRLGEEQAAYHVMQLIDGEPTEQFVVLFRVGNAIDLAVGTAPTSLARTVATAKIASDLLTTGHLCR